VLLGIKDRKVGGCEILVMSYQVGALLEPNFESKEKP